MTRIAPPAPNFDDIKPFPGENNASAPAGIGHNRPPLEEQVVLDLEEQIDGVPGLRKRITELVEKAASLPDCNDEDTAGKLADFKKMADTASSRVEAIRKALKDPILTAGKNLDAKARTYTDALDNAARQAKLAIDRFVAEQQRQAREAEETRRREEHARWLQEQEAQRAAAAHAHAEPATPPPTPEAEPMPQRAKAAPIATGDYGARVGTRTVWRHEEITDLKALKQLPKEVLGHPKVFEAVNQVIAAMVRTGIREIKGVTIAQHTESNIR